MKKLLLIVCILSVFTSCKNESKTEVKPEGSEKTTKQDDGLVLLQGEFVYYADAGVLQIANNTMYGIIINDKIQELNDLAKPFKKEDTDYVFVEVRGKLIPKPENEEGWDYKIDIKEILNVTASKVNDVIKLGSK